MSFVNSIKDHLRFASAREFWQTNHDNGAFAYQKNAIEKMGDIFVWPIFKNSDSFLKRIREPYMIIAMTTTAIGVATLIFYPEKSINIINSVVPITSVIEPKVVKFATYLLSQATIFGFGARTLGRLSNNSLVTAWNSKTIVAITIGTVID